MIAASILEYMFIAVTCCDCEETAKKPFEHFMDVLYGIEVCGRTHFGVCVSITASASLPSKFQDFPGPGNVTNTIPEFSRRLENPGVPV